MVKEQSRQTQAATETWLRTPEDEILPPVTKGLKCGWHAKDRKSERGRQILSHLLQRKAKELSKPGTAKPWMIGTEVTKVAVGSFCGVAGVEG